MGFGVTACVTMRMTERDSVILCMIKGNTV